MAVGIALAVIGVAQAGYGMYQQADSANKLDKMGERAQFEITPEQLASKRRADERARYGYQPQQRAALEQGLARSQNTGYQRALDTGGGQLAAAIKAAMAYTNFHGQNKIAFDDAVLQDRNVQYADMRGDRISDQRNQIVQSDQHAYDQLASAYGAEGQAGAQNMFSGARMAAGGLDMYQTNQNAPIWSPEQPYTGSSYPQDPNAVPSRTATPYNPPMTDYSSPSIYRQTNNPQLDNGSYSPMMFDFASSYSRKRYNNPPYEAAPY